MTNILILDDDFRIREALSDLLLEAGFRVDVAESYAWADALLLNEPYDVVICDWDLGVYGLGQPGYELSLLAQRAEQEEFRLICFSGLDRIVPPGVEQFRKDQVLELRDALMEDT